EGRVITLEYPDFYLINAYVPNAQPGLARIDFREEFEDNMRNYLIELDQHKPIIYCGDLNVAHNPIDLKNDKANEGQPGYSIQERNKMTALLNSNFVDTFRYFYPDKEQYTWWSYRGRARANNVGWRIDYFIASARIMDKVKDSVIYDQVLGSDHCPVGLILK
ncbi:MAG: exodeoxyribonuclease III, partial [Christensenellaceae bacterium]|nr:exodeoxyribonuclease III [Christensenellaceae bacterium]